MSALAQSGFAGSVHVIYFIGLALFASQLPSSLANVAWIFGMAVTLPLAAIYDGVRWPEIASNWRLLTAIAAFSAIFGTLANYFLAKAVVASPNLATAIPAIMTIVLVPVLLYAGYRNLPRIFPVQGISAGQWAGVALGIVTIVVSVFGDSLFAYLRPVLRVARLAA